MWRFRRAVSVAGLLTLLCVVSNLPAQQSPAGAGAPQGARTPALFFREDWKLDPKIPPSAPPNAFEQEHTLGQGDVANPNLELKKYGDTTGPVIVYQPSVGNITFAMTMLCTSNCAQALRDKSNYVDLTGLARIRWRTKVGGFHQLHPILKLADGTWLVGDRSTGFSSDWVESDFLLQDFRWRNLDIENVVEGKDGKWVDNPDLSKVDEIGFTDLMRGTGHGNGGGSRIDWIEVYGKPVPRGTAAQTSAR